MLIIGTTRWQKPTNYLAARGLAPGSYNEKSNRWLLTTLPLTVTGT